jgi:hypothetical protein
VGGCPAIRETTSPNDPSSGLMAQECGFFPN